MELKLKNLRKKIFSLLKIKAEWYFLKSHLRKWDSFETWFGRNPFETNVSTQFTTICESEPHLRPGFAWFKKDLVETNILCNYTSRYLWSSLEGYVKPMGNPLETLSLVGFFVDVVGNYLPISFWYFIDLRIFGITFAIE